MLVHVNAHLAADILYMEYFKINLNVINRLYIHTHTQIMCLLVCKYTQTDTYKYVCVSVHMFELSTYSHMKVREHTRR